MARPRALVLCALLPLLGAVGGAASAQTGPPAAGDGTGAVGTGGADPGAGLPGAVERSIDPDAAWSWFQDERAVLRDCRLLVGGSGSDGEVDVHELDLGAGWIRHHVLARGARPNDHHAPALLAGSDGATLASWSLHGDDRLLRVDRRGAGAALFGTTALARAEPVSYSNLVAVPGEGAVYDFFRAEGWDPNVVRSLDGGRTWVDLGRLFTTPPGVRPYVKYAGDGDRRIYLVATDTHPNHPAADRTHLWAGYLESGVVHRSDGTPVAALGTPLAPSQLTPVHLVPAGTYTWPSDLHVIDGVPVAAFTVQVGRGDAATRRYAQARWAGGDGWQVVDAGAAGRALYPVEDFYTGNVALDPGEADRIYVSADVHPGTGVPLVSAADGRRHWELFEGRSGDGGATWVWHPLTANSRVDNIRPIVPVPTDRSRALVWLRGTYRTYRSYGLEVVARVSFTGDPAACAGPPEVQVGGSPLPVSGDFDGDGLRDVLWYGPGPQPDHLAIADGHQGFASRVVTVRGVGYVPVAGDFDGDGVDDVLWYGPGALGDSIWWGSPAGRFTSTAVSVKGARYQPVAGDFNGDGRDDVLWYGPGGIADSVWWGRPGRTYQSKPTVVRGADYRPVAGDFDGDGRDDVLWYGPGGIRDSVWWGRPGGFTSAPTTFTGVGYQPVAGDFDGDGIDDVFWFGPGTLADQVWYGDRSRAPHAVAVSTAPGAHQPVVADLGHGSGDDVLWFHAGAVPERVWYGEGSRSFLDVG